MLLYNRYLVFTITNLSPMINSIFFFLDKITIYEKYCMYLNINKLKLKLLLIDIGTLFFFLL